MRFLTHAGIDPGRLRAAFDKVRMAIEREDWRSADVKKLESAPYYRAKLDAANRLVLTFVRHGGEAACLALEIIANHDYGKSRFLRGARVDEARILMRPTPESPPTPRQCATCIPGAASSICSTRLSRSMTPRRRSIGCRRRW